MTDADFIITLGNRAHALRLLDAGEEATDVYWLRVWAARGLLWAGPGSSDVLHAALVDEHWRVREMACKVIARHRVGDLLSEVSAREDDEADRVREAARRAVTRIVEAGA